MHRNAEIEPLPNGVGFKLQVHCFSLSLIDGRQKAFIYGFGPPK
jgi:hypothetical protein